MLNMNFKCFRLAFIKVLFRSYHNKTKTEDSLSNYDFYSDRLLRCIHQPSVLFFRLLSVINDLSMPSSTEFKPEDFNQIF